LILTLSTLLFVYQVELFQFVQDVEMKKDINPIGVAAILITFQILTAPLGFPGVPITITIGALFGFFFGAVVALIGNTLGGCLAFLLSRYVLQNYVQKKILPHHPKIRRYERKLTQRGFATVLVLRIIPLFPFNTLNFLLGTTNISFKKYVLGSFAGLLPGTFLFVYFGNSLRMLSVANIILAIVGIAALTYLGIFYEKKSR
jgi:uncharacterized membrane protein YdjX (TVP38/TMEM64 family)